MKVSETYIFEMKLYVFKDNAFSSHVHQIANMISDVQVIWTFKWILNLSG